LALNTFYHQGCLPVAGRSGETPCPCKSFALSSVWLFRTAVKDISPEVRTVAHGIRRTARTARPRCTPGEGERHAVRRGAGQPGHGRSPHRPGRPLVAAADRRLPGDAPAPLPRTRLPVPAQAGPLARARYPRPGSGGAADHLLGPGPHHPPE